MTINELFVKIVLIKEKINERRLYEKKARILMCFLISACSLKIWFRVYFYKMNENQEREYDKI